MQFNLAFKTFSKIRYIIQPSRFNSKVPANPVLTLEKQTHERTHVDTNTIALLERLSLVKCDTDEGVKVLEDSIAFADKILHIDTTGVEPLYTVLENEALQSHITKKKKNTPNSRHLSMTSLQPKRRYNRGHYK